MVIGQIEIHNNCIPMLCMGGNANTSQLKYFTVGIFPGGIIFVCFFCHQVPSMKILPVKNICMYTL